MTNEEKAELISEQFHCNDVAYDAAEQMAEWKDEQHSQEKQQWLKKACEWLKDNIDDYYTTGDGGDEFEGWFDDMFEDFRKAMKGE